MASIIIRPAKETDIERLCDLYIEFHEFHARYLPIFLQSMGEPSKQQRLELSQELGHILQKSDASILVAEKSGTVIGFAEVHLRLPDLKERAKTHTRYAHLQSLMVTEPYRHKRVGIFLLKATEDWARAHGAIELRLDIWEFAAGPLKFYQKSGYRTFRRSLIKNI